MDISQLERDFLGDLWVSPFVDHLATYAPAMGVLPERRMNVGRRVPAGSFPQVWARNVTAEPFEMRGWERGQPGWSYRMARRDRTTCLAIPAPWAVTWGGDRRCKGYPPTLNGWALP
jgi:hypothetical protein